MGNPWGDRRSARIPLTRTFRCVRVRVRGIPADRRSPHGFPTIRGSGQPLHGNIGGGFAVYRKPTCKDDYIHYLSAHSEKVKSGVVIGLFLRALRICSPEYLEDEFNHVIEAFKRLHYPLGMLLRLRRTAITIRERGPRQRQQDTRPILVIPLSPLTEQLEAHLGHHLRIATPAQTKIGEMVKTPRPRHAPEDSVIYKIPCGEQSCKEAYFGQTCRGLKKRLSEHVAAYNKRDQQSPFLLHRWATDHQPGWKKAEVVHKGVGSKRNSSSMSLPSSEPTRASTQDPDRGVISV